jgi:hypothetical protein
MYSTWYKAKITKLVITKIPNNNKDKVIIILMLKLLLLELLVLLFELFVSSPQLRLLLGLLGLLLSL